VTNTLATCVGWLFDISIENDKAILWIKTIDRQILKLREYYQPSCYILPRNESDGLQLLRILSQQQDIVQKVSWKEDKFTNLFDSTDKKKLIRIQLQSIRYYLPLIRKIFSQR
jgi:hypothetical protein